MPDLLKPSEILALWPSFRAIERDLDVPQQTVGSWSSNEAIPAGYWSDLEASAERRSIEGVTFDVLARSVAAMQRERVQERLRKRKERQNS